MKDERGEVREMTSSGSKGLGGSWRGFVGGVSKAWDGIVDDCVAMPSTMTFRRAQAVDWPAKRRIAVCGTEASLGAAARAGILPGGVADILLQLLPKMAPNSLGCAAKTHILLPPCGGVEELVVGLVTTEASRHASPHRADQVRNFVRKNVAASPDAALFLSVPNKDALYAFSTQAPRGHSLCKFKGANDGFDANGTFPMEAGLFIAGGEAVTDADIETANVVAASSQLASRLLELPANCLNTRTYARIIQGLGRKFGFGVRLIEGEDVLKEGMELLYHVGHAAEYGAVLAVLSHVPKQKVSDEVVCWAGKGIVYDCGGLQLKTKSGMPNMKKDMGGSAAVLGAFVAAVRLGAQFELHTLLALAENAVSAVATRPDDIHRCLSGYTVEVNNTDAEGRLVLADAVAFAHRHLKPTRIIDMATLTGAQGIATGQHYASILSNSESLELRVLKAGKESSDQCFPIVFAPEVLLPEFDSPLADFRNSVAGRKNAQASCAGLFIWAVGLGGAKFNGEWLHVDMSALAMADGYGCGWGVSLLLRLSSVC